MQPERNNERAVYRSKENVIMNQTSGYIYLYSFNATEHADNENYEILKYLTGSWVVRFIKYLISSNFLLVNLMIEKHT